MRRPRPFVYTWQQIADLLGLTILTAKRYGQGVARKFDPRDIASVFTFAQSRKAPR